MMLQCCMGNIGLVVHQKSYMYNTKWPLRFWSWRIFFIAQTGLRQPAYSWP